MKSAPAPATMRNQSESGDVGRHATGDGPEHEARGDRHDVDHRLVLEPQRVRQCHREVRADDGRELAVVDRQR